MGARASITAARRTAPRPRRARRACAPSPTSNAVSTTPYTSAVSAAVIVSAPGTSRRAALGAEVSSSAARPSTDDEDAERDVDEQHRTPAERPVRTPPRRMPSAPPPAEVALHTASARVARARRGVGRGQQAERAGREQRGADALHGARAEQHAAAGRDAAREAREREDRPADQVHALAAVVVADPPAEQDQAAERQQVGVDHPLQVGGAEVQAAPYRRQCDVDDRRVQHHHALPQARRRERRPRGKPARGPRASSTRQS